MSNKEKQKKEKVVWASGRGGIGNVHKAKAPKAPVDVYIPKQQKLLEVETARNRKTTNGRGGSGNRFYHCVEPGVFQRVLDHEAARIMAHKAEEAANKAYKESGRNRSKSITPLDDAVRRISMRFRSASTSFSTSIGSGSGSSASPLSDASSSRQSILSPISLGIARRSFSPFKKQTFDSTADAPNIRSDNLNASPTVHRERSFSLNPMASTDSGSPITNNRWGGSSSLGLASTQLNPSCLQPSSPRYEVLQASRDLEHDNYSDIYSSRVRSFTQSSIDVSVGMFAEKTSDVRRAGPYLDWESNKSSPDLIEAQARQFVAYHLPTRKVGHQDKAVPSTRREDLVQSF